MVAAPGLAGGIEAWSTKYFGTVPAPCSAATGRSRRRISRSFALPVNILEFADCKSTNPAEGHLQQTMPAQCASHVASSSQWVLHQYSWAQHCTSEAIRFSHTLVCEDVNGNYTCSACMGTSPSWLSVEVASSTDVI